MAYSLPSQSRLLLDTPRLRLNGRGFSGKVEEWACWYLVETAPSRGYGGNAVYDGSKLHVTNRAVDIMISAPYRNEAFLKEIEMGFVTFLRGKDGYQGFLTQQRDDKMAGMMAFTNGVSQMGWWMVIIISFINFYPI